MKFRALALLFLAVASAQGVILYRTGDPAANTTEPTGPGYNNSGWQYEGSWGGFLGTPIAPHFFLSAAHIGNSGNSVFYYQNATYHVVHFTYDPKSDLVLWEVAEEFPVVAPLYSRTDELGQRLMVFGRGTQRGSAAIADNVLRGWKWGAGDSAQRWGENVVASIEPGGIEFDLLRSTFDANGLPNECHLSSGDSGGAAFIEDAGIWKLAGINYAVDGAFYTDAAGHGEFDGALFDRGGFYEPYGANFVPSSGPSAFYPTRISTKLPWIGSVVARPIQGVEEGYATLTYTKFLLPATDLIYSVQQSSDLSSWQDVSASDEIISTSATAQVVKSKIALPEESAPLFLRLQVRRP